MDIRIGDRSVGLREQRVVVDPAAQTLRDKLASGRVWCQRGGASRGAQDCASCEHMVDAFPDGSVDGLVVRCGWDSHDPARGLMSLPDNWAVVSPAATVREVRSVLAGGVGEVLVVERGELVGLVTGRQVARAATDIESIDSVMSRTILSVGADTWLSTCCQLLRDPDVPCLAVVEGSRLVGIVAREDLARVGLL